jgi:hypothetical protein
MAEKHDEMEVEIEEGELWEPWETKLVVVSIVIGIAVLVVGGIIANLTILA